MKSLELYNEQVLFIVNYICTTRIQLTQKKNNMKS